LDHYPWDYILEPYRRARVTILQDGALYGKLDYVLESTAQTGHTEKWFGYNSVSVEIECEHPGSLYTLNVFPAGTLPDEDKQVCAPAVA
jgi:hypothetical protein